MKRVADPHWLVVLISAITLYAVVMVATGHPHCGWLPTDPGCR